MKRELDLSQQQYTSELIEPKDMSAREEGSRKDNEQTIPSEDALRERGGFYVHVPAYVDEPTSHRKVAADWLRGWAVVKESEGDEGKKTYDVVEFGYSCPDPETREKVQQFLVSSGQPFGIGTFDRLPKWFREQYEEQKAEEQRRQQAKELEEQRRKDASFER